jgi:hypothetical protein
MGMKEKSSILALQYEYSMEVGKGRKTMGTIFIHLSVCKSVFVQQYENLWLSNALELTCFGIQALVEQITNTFCSLWVFEANRLGLIGKSCISWG